MKTFKQIQALVKQELRSATRARYVILSFVLGPLFMWGIQGGIQALMGFMITSSQQTETLYVANYDLGNSRSDFAPFSNLGELFIQSLNTSSQSPDSLLEGATINTDTYSSWEYSELIELINNPQKADEATPLVIIPKNFTDVYLAYNSSLNHTISPVVELYTLPSGLIGSSVIEAAVTMTAKSLFTKVIVEKDVTVSTKMITFPGEEEAVSGFGIGFIGMISIMVAVMVPSSFVSTSFAGEREKKTMESLLALPISRFNILFSKLLAGMVLVGIFTVMNIIGLLGFSAIIGSIKNDSYSSVFSIEPSVDMLVLTTLMMLLSAFIAMGIGISLASLSKDVRSAESMYTFTMMFPAIGVGMIGMIGGLPEQTFGGIGLLFYLIPWTHSTALLSKGLYPQTYASSTLTGSIPLDLVLHFGYLLFLIFACLFVASKVFEREGILT
ncbi:MAG: ABC transporter permease [Candidatus Heimdallarchaeota archaeon]|nr:MAG: ABC transporter permease [Candidatus Heimdallarchaeota archaeon]